MIPEAKLNLKANEITITEIRNTHLKDRNGNALRTFVALGKLARMGIFPSRSVRFRNCDRHIHIFNRNEIEAVFLVPAKTESKKELDTVVKNDTESTFMTHKEILSVMNTFTSRMWSDLGYQTFTLVSGNRLIKLYRHADVIEYLNSKHVKERSKRRDTVAYRKFFASHDKPKVIAPVVQANAPDADMESRLNTIEEQIKSFPSIIAQVMQNEMRKSR